MIINRPRTGITTGPTPPSCSALQLLPWALVCGGTLRVLDFNVGRESARQGAAFPAANPCVIPNLCPRNPDTIVEEGEDVSGGYHGRGGFSNRFGK